MKYNSSSRYFVWRVPCTKEEVEERVGLLGELKAQERDLIAAKTAVSFFDWFDLVVVIVVDVNIYIKHPKYK